MIPGIVASGAAGGPTFTMPVAVQLSIGTGTSFTITAAIDFGGYTPVAGDLLIVAIEMEDVAHAGVASSSGMTKRVGVDTTGGTSGSASFWDKTLGAGETSWTFTFASDLGTVQAYVLHPTGGAWTFDKSSTNAPAGTGTSVATGSTGTLTVAPAFAVAAAQRATSPGGDNSIDNGFTILNPTNHLRGCGGYQTVATNAALSPTLTWAFGAVARCGAVATWYLT